MELLPPSAFQVIPINTPPQNKKDELKDLQKEVQSLQEENAQLRLESSASKNVATVAKPETPCARQILVASDNKPHEYHKYVDELINRQAAEINTLKFQLQDERTALQREAAELEQQNIDMGRQHRQQCSQLEAAIEDQQHKYDKQLDFLTKEYKDKEGSLRKQLEELTSELTAMKLQSSSTINKLQEECAMLRSSKNEEILAASHQLRSNEIELDNKEKHISQLKKYIGDTESTHKPIEAWRKDNETLRNKLKISESEKENLNSNIELLNIRLKAANDIISLQESEVSKSKQSTIGKAKVEDLLLSRWREKVFELMVQQKSNDILIVKNDREVKTQITELEEELSLCDNQLSVYKCSLSDKDAQIEMLSNNSVMLQREVSEAQNIAVQLDDTLCVNREAMNCLVTAAKGIGSKFQQIMDNFKTVCQTLMVYEQRIGFAVSRVDIIQSQITRKKALQVISGQPELSAAEKPLEETTTSQMHPEMERLIEERDHMASQIRRDTQMWKETLDSVKQQYEDELHVLRKTSEGLELSLQEKSQNIERQIELIERLEEEKAENETTIEQLKTELGRHEITIERALDSQKISDNELFAEKFTEVERKLNDAQRDHAKAVVSLRQMERQMTRDKDRHQEQIKTMEDHYNKQLQHLKTQLKSVEKERNIMMASLRQEGLLGKLRQERLEPLQLELDESVERASVHSDIPQSDLSADGMIQEIGADGEDENIAAVLEDIESLTAAVLDNDSSSEEH